MDEKAIVDGYKDADLSGLSDEERAALLGEESEETDAATEEPTAEAEVEETATTEDEPKAEEAAAEESAEDADEDAEDADDGQDAVAEDKEQATDEKDPFVPKYKLDEVEQEAAENLEKALAELDAKFEEGELSATDYRKALAEINNPVLIEQAKRAAMEEITRQNTEQLWQRQQDEFFGLYPDYRESAIKFAGMQAALSDLYSEEANAGKSGTWFLREAKTAVDREMGITPQAADAPAPAPKPELPKSLASVPKADAEGTGDKYSALDQLEGLELEKAIARMSESELEAFGTAA